VKLVTAPCGEVVEVGVMASSKRGRRSGGGRRLKVARRLPQRTAGDSGGNGFAGDVGEPGY